MSTKIAEKFEASMKTGFLSVFILIILEKGPSYGYKISKEIEKRTLGLWEIPSSTLYTVLKDMTEKKLISYIEKQVEGRNRKIYEITQKGHSTLNIMLEKKNIIEHSFETLKTAMLGEDRDEHHDKFHKFGPLDLILNRLDEKTEKEQLEFLELQKLVITRDIKSHKEIIRRIDEIITKLKKRITKAENN
jgi:PadR family transcriptional regulator PadR